MTLISDSSRSRGIVPALRPRRHVVNRTRQIGQEPPRGLERVLLGVDRVIDGAAAHLDRPATEFLFGAGLAQALHHRRAGDEDGGDLLDHHGVMRRDQTGRAQTGDRAEAETDDRNLGHVVGDEVEGGGLAKPAREIGAAGGLDGLDRAAAARAFDQPDDRHAEPGRELLRHFRLALDRGIGRAAAHGEIVAGDDDGPAIDRAAAKHAVARHEVRDVTFGVVGGFAGDAADLLERAGIEQAIDALPHRQAAAFVLTLDPFLAAHLAGECLALTEFGELRFPTNLRGLRKVDAVVHPFPAPDWLSSRWLIGAAQRCQVSSGPSPAFRRMVTSFNSTMTMGVGPEGSTYLEPVPVVVAGQTGSRRCHDRRAVDLKMLFPGVAPMAVDRVRDRWPDQAQKQTMATNASAGVHDEST